MATLEDKILGDHKRDNYCSSSEDEDGYVDALDGNEADNINGSSNKQLATASIANNAHYTSEIDNWSGSATNTGPKGVIRDWQRFKQLENERNDDKKQEQMELLKKLSITAKTNAEDAAQNKQDELDSELAELLNDDGILLRFQQQRMQEMLAQCGHKLKRFGHVHALISGDDFLHAIDNEDKLVTIVIHIYENRLASCRTMNKCLDELAQSYESVKFCKIAGSAAGMSQNFKASGIPALLVYKGSNLVGNFVRISNDLGGDDFFSSDVEGFLIEHAMLPDKSHLPVIINDGNNCDDDDD